MIFNVTMRTTIAAKGRVKTGSGNKMVRVEGPIDTRGDV